MWVVWANTESDTGWVSFSVYARLTGGLVEALYSLGCSFDLLFIHPSVYLHVAKLMNKYFENE